MAIVGRHGVPAFRMLKEAILHKFVPLAMGKLTRKRATDQGCCSLPSFPRAYQRTGRRCTAPRFGNASSGAAARLPPGPGKSCVSCHSVTHPLRTAQYRDFRMPRRKIGSQATTAVRSIKFCFFSRALYAESAAIPVPSPELAGPCWDPLKPHGMENAAATPGAVVGRQKATHR